MELLPNVPMKDTPLASLIQQVLDALKKATVESEKVRKYLREFFDKLHEDLVKELRGRGEITAANQDRSLHQVSDEVKPQAGSSNLLVAYRTITETSISLSIQS